MKGFWRQTFRYWVPQNFIYYWIGEPQNSKNKPTSTGPPQSSHMLQLRATKNQYKRCNNVVSYEFLWIRWTGDNIWLNSYVLFSSRFRIRCSVRLVSGYAHAFVLLSVMIAALSKIKSSSVSRACFYHIRDLRRIRSVINFNTAKTSGTSFVHLISAIPCTMVFQKLNWIAFNTSRTLSPVLLLLLLNHLMIWRWPLWSFLTYWRHIS